MGDESKIYWVCEVWLRAKFQAVEIHGIYSDKKSQTNKQTNKQKKAI